MATIHVEPARARARKVASWRFFFVGLGLFAIGVAATAFVPEYARFAAGKFPIARVLHVHGALMAAWLATFVLQAGLASTGRVALHRKIGPYAVALGVAAWVSMVAVVVRHLVVNPLPVEWGPYDELLQDVYTDTMFIALLLWAAYERRRPAWHKRLMAIAVIVALVAPIERFVWLPELGGGFVWSAILWQDLCLIVSLIAYDLASARRLHPATALGLALPISAQGAMYLAWGTAPWRHFAFVAVHAARAAFGV